MSAKPRTSVVLTEPQVACLKAEASRLGITLGELVRRIVDQYREAKCDRTGYLEEPTPSPGGTSGATARRGHA
jgi:hypothetical protein